MVYPVPPEVLTRELFDTLKSEETKVDLRACNDCVEELMEE